MMPLTLDAIGSLFARVRRSQQRPNNTQQHWNSSQNPQAPTKHGSNPTEDMLRTEWAAFQALIREIHKGDKEHQAAEQKLARAQLRTAKRLNWITGIGAIISVIGLLGIIGSLVIAKHAADDGSVVAGAARDQARASMEANRAWIAPVIAYIVNATDPLGSIIRYGIKFQNVGREPALNLAFKTDYGLTDVPPGEDGNDFVFEANTTCDQLTPSEKGSVEFPAPPLPQTDPSLHAWLGRTDSVKGKKITLDQGIIDDTRRLYVMGCAAYQTINAVGKTKFCYMAAYQHINGRQIYNRDGTPLVNVFACPGWSAE